MCVEGPGSYVCTHAQIAKCRHPQAWVDPSQRWLLRPKTALFGASSAGSASALGDTHKSSTKRKAPMGACTRPTPLRLCTKHEPHKPHKAYPKAPSRCKDLSGTVYLTDPEGNRLEHCGSSREEGHAFGGTVPATGQPERMLGPADRGRQQTKTKTAQNQTVRQQTEFGLSSNHLPHRIQVI